MHKKYHTSEEAKVLGHAFVDKVAECLRIRLREKLEKTEIYV